MGEAATIDEIDDEDLDTLHITACKERLAQLEAEKEKREEAIERAQVKLKALNSELASRNEEVMSLKDNLKDKNARALEEDRENKAVVEVEDQSFLQEEREVKIRRFLEEQLKQKAQKRSARNEFGIRMFDEMELMVRKPLEDQKREMDYIDTVLITWSKAASSEQTYNLSYRVDRAMTAKKLREDACFYWGISEVEYILKTVTTNSKVQDDVMIQNCFRTDEDAHLLLVHKTPTQETPTQEELKAIAPKMGPLRLKNRQKNTSATDKKPTDSKPTTDFRKQLDAVPGLKDFLLQGDQNVKAHLDRIKLHSLCMFFILSICTLLSMLSVRPANTEFIIHHGFTSALTAARVDLTTGFSIPDFEAIASRDQAWLWLEHTLPEQLLTETSRLRRDNYLPGWVHMRMQRVAPPSQSQCNELLRLTDAACAADSYDSNTAYKADLEEVRELWANRTGAGRSPLVVPWRFEGDTAHFDRTGGRRQAGIYSSYDRSGYPLEYDLQFPNLTETKEAFLSDMTALRSVDWLSTETRALHVIFAAYNGNLDYWVSVSLVLEMPAMGFVHPRVNIAAYQESMTDSDYEYQLVLDLIRLSVVIYLGTWHLGRELRYESRKRPGRRMWRLIGWRDLIDLTITGFCLYVCIVRYFVLGIFTDTSAAQASKLGDEYLAVHGTEVQYRQHAIAESFLLAFAVLRLLSCLRVNRHIFIIWEAINRSLKRYSSFMLIFWPVLLGFTILGHAIWRSHLKEYKSFWSSIAATLMLLCGENSVLDVRSGREGIRPFTLVYMIFFNLVMVLLFVNSWVAVVTQMYERTRISAGYNPQEYDWTSEEWLRWTLWSPLARLVARIRRRRKGDDAEK